MLNLNYLKYLFNSKKYLLLFIFILTVLAVVGIEEGVACGFVFGIACILTYVIPVDTFAYLHNKRAVDSYFSLPLKRKELLFTGLLFSIIVVVLIFALGYGSIELINKEFNLTTSLDILFILLGLITLIIFNTLLYQIGNSVLDGIVMIAAYSLLPFVMYLLMDFYFDQFVYGFEIVNSDVETYFSPLYMSIANYMNIRQTYHYYRYGYLIALVIILVVSTIILYYAFDKRKVERANSTSNLIFAYPLIISLYALACLLALAFEFNNTYGSFLEYLNDYSIFLIIIFALYISAHFIYKRSFYFNYKLPLIFIGMFVLCVGFSVISRSTEGFGIAYKYNTVNINRCNIYINNLSDDLRKEFDVGRDDYAWIVINMGEIGKTPISEEVLKMIDEKRLESISAFYAGEKETYDQSINIYNNYSLNSGGLYSFSDNYVYSSKCNFTYDDLLKIAKDESCEVLIEKEDVHGKLKADGQIDFVGYSVDNEPIAYEKY